jgi:FAD/FMN-containing dehydrogenase
MYDADPEARPSAALPGVHAVNIQTLDRRELDLPTETVNAFRARLRGPLLVPGDSGYDDSRTVWNAMIDRRPALVARCLGVADIVAGVSFAREHGLLLSIKGGGHNIAGLATCDGGLMLDMSLMRGVWVDPAARVARVQPGCLLGDVDRETQVRGLATALGFVSATGATGLTLGGGFGYLTPRFGWTSDCVTAMEIVAPDGRTVRASETENPELFWALRGGGGNFGVVSGIEYRLFPVGPEIIGGAIAWRGDRAPQALELLERVMKDAPPELGIAAVLRPAPPAPWLNPAVHGKPIIVFAICYTGAPEHAERLLAPIKAFGDPVGDIVQRRPYTTQQALLDATQPKGRRYYWKSEYLPGLSQALFSKVVEHAGRISSPHSGVVLFPIGGEIHKLPNDHSAVGNRDARWVVNLTASWEKADQDAEQIEWARSAWRDVRPLSTGGTYINFLTADEGDDRIQAAYGANLARLAEVKRRWDPENMLRMNKNIPPRS